MVRPYYGTLFASYDILTTTGDNLKKVCCMVAVTSNEGDYYTKIEERRENNDSPQFIHKSKVQFWNSKD